MDMFEAWTRFNTDGDGQRYANGYQNLFYAGVAYGALASRMSDEEVFRAIEEAFKNSGQSGAIER